MSSHHGPLQGCILAGAALLACATAFAQRAVLEPVDLPASAVVLPAAAQTSERSAEGPALADGTEEVVVQGRSMRFLRDRLTLAEDNLYAIYNEINTVDEFDIHCRMHGATGTRMVQRQCLPNYVKDMDERKAQAFHRVYGGEGSYDLDWQSPMAALGFKTAELERHMQTLALEHPELLEAMQTLYGLMEAAYPGRFADTAER